MTHSFPRPVILRPHTPPQQVRAQPAAVSLPDICIRILPYEIIVVILQPILTIENYAYTYQKYKGTGAGRERPAQAARPGQGDGADGDHQKRLPYRRGRQNQGLRNDGNGKRKAESGKRGRHRRRRHGPYGLPHLLRLAHPPGLRQFARARVCRQDPRPQLRGDRQARRRHTQLRQSHGGGLGGRALRAGPAAPRRGNAPRHRRHRNQERLRPFDRKRAEAAARHPPPQGELASDHPVQLPRRPRHPDEVPRPSGRLCRPGNQRDAAARGGRGPGRLHRRLLRPGLLHRRRHRPHPRGRHQIRPAPKNPRQRDGHFGRRAGRREIQRHIGRPPRADGRRRNRVPQRQRHDAHHPARLRLLPQPAPLAGPPYDRSRPARGNGIGLQPRHFALVQYAARPLDGLHPLPPDPRRGPQRHHPQHRLRYGRQRPAGHHSRR